jgi:beta-lactamase regulating signal transducer with metallopeptidase domain
MQQFLTWLWQGTTLAVGVWALLRLLRPNPATRFAIWWATLLALFALLVIPAPLARLRSNHTADRDVASAASSADAISAAGAFLSGASGAEAHAAAPTPRPALTPAPAAIAFVFENVPLTLPAVPPALLAMGIGTWLGFALLGLVHLVVSASHLQRLKLACRPFPLVRERRLARWMDVRGKGRRARLCVTEDVRSASALGLGVGFAPSAAIIAINPSLLADLDDDELDHIVLHEYAHLQRRDDWLHALQLAMQALLIVHPAVSSIGRALRLEREAACDDWVVERTRLATTYARGLTKVAAFELTTPNDLIAAMGVVGRSGDLTRRIERLLAPPPTPRRWPAYRLPAHSRVAAMPVASVAVLLIAATVGLWRLPPLVTMDVASEDVAGAASTEFAASSHALPSAAALASALDPLTRAAAIIVMPERLIERARESDAEPPVSANARRGPSRVHDASSDTTKVVATTVGATSTAAAAADAGADAPETAAAREAASLLAGQEAMAVPSAAPKPSRAFARMWSSTSLATSTSTTTSTSHRAAAPAHHGLEMAASGASDASNATPIANTPVPPALTPAPAPDAVDAAHNAAAEEEALTATIAAARPQRPWQRAAGVGMSGAKRVGTATSGFVSRVASSIGKVLP